MDADTMETVARETMCASVNNASQTAFPGVELGAGMTSTAVAEAPGAVV